MATQSVITNQSSTPSAIFVRSLMARRAGVAADPILMIPPGPRGEDPEILPSDSVSCVASEHARSQRHGSVHSHRARDPPENHHRDRYSAIAEEEQERQPSPQQEDEEALYEELQRNQTFPDEQAQVPEYHEPHSQGSHHSHRAHSPARSHGERRHSKHISEGDMLRTKHAILMELLTLQGEGAILTRQFSLDDNLNEMHFELVRQRNDVNCKAAVIRWTMYLVIIFLLVELVNDKLGSPLHIQGFAMHLQTNCENLRIPLQRCYHRYSQYAATNPLIDLLQVLVLSMGAFHANGVMNGSRGAPAPASSMSALFPMAMGMMNNMFNGKAKPEAQAPPKPSYAPSKTGEAPPSNGSTVGGGSTYAPSAMFNPPSYRPFVPAAAPSGPGLRFPSPPS